MPWAAILQPEPRCSWHARIGVPLPLLRLAGDLELIVRCSIITYHYTLVLTVSYSLPPLQRSPNSPIPPTDSASQQ